MERKKIIAANFKMNLTSEEIDNYINNFEIDKKNVIIFPSSIYIDRFKDKNISLGVQNISQYDDGAYTGEISANQVKDLVDYALIGHSERRTIFNESDITINEKIKSAQRYNLKVMLCIGESIETRKANKTMDFLSNQLELDLKDVDISNIVIAYEPIWAIGTGIIPTVKEIESTIKFIKEKVKNLTGHDIMVLYGGSVNLKNIEELEKISNVDGYLIGGASLDSNNFKKIIEVVDNQ